MADTPHFSVPPSIPKCKDILWDASGILVIGQSGEIVIANQKAEAIFGSIPGGLVKSKVERLMDKDFEEKHIELREDYMLEPTWRAMNAGRKVKGVRIDGRQIDLIVTLTPFYEDCSLFVMATINELINGVKPI